MPAPSTPATSPGKNISTVFRKMVNALIAEMDETKHPYAVDVEVNFASVTINQKGIPLFVKNTTQSQMQIKLATRVVPGER
jgi:hypothetical protein